LLLTIVGAFLVLNLGFAGAYVVLDAEISDAVPGSFLDAFFFSVQTMSTIGYGAMSPLDTTAETLVTMEAVVGILITATATGLIFSKFATPTARIAFSRNLVIRKYDGVPTLFMRLANERASFIVEAKVQITFLRDEVSLEGEQMRRFYDLRLARDSSPVFAMGWTVMHPIDEESPLHGLTPSELEEVDGGFLIGVTGIDETLSQTVHARQYYGHDDVVWNARFVDMMGQLPDGKRSIDFSKLHEYEPLEPDAVELVVVEGASAVGE
jgi:inward rectifier potassium channel